MQKIKDDVYNRKDLQSLWAEIAEVIMRYITHDGHYANIFSYHFMILNHFRYNKIISLPFYLLSFLENSLANHTKNSDNLVVHEGLIKLIMEYAKDYGVKPSPTVQSPNSLTNTSIHYVFDRKMDSTLR